MKLILCTLAICLSTLASVLTLKELIRAEGKKIRCALPKELAEPADAASRPEALVQKLDAVNAQLGTFSRRLASLEEFLARQNPPSPSRAFAGDSQSLTKNGAVSTATFARLDAISGHLADLTTFLDQSFDHVEKTVTETASAQRFAEALDPLSKKLDALDSYFTPLYAFLGLGFDPASADLLAAYPSVDVRINDLFLQLDALRKDVNAIREQVTPRRSPY